MNESKPCEKCSDHGERIAKLEVGAEWMESALDEIRKHTREVAGYAQQLVEVAHQTATMSEAVGRAFDEIERERTERKESVKEIRDVLIPISQEWGGVAEATRWVKMGVIAIVGIVFAAMIGMVIT